MSVNKAILVGNVGRDPEVRSTQSGSKVANLSLATNERWTNKQGQRQERTEWHRVTVFGDNLIERVIEPYVKKGTTLYIEGQIRTRKWQDDSGNDHYSTEIIVDQFNGALTFVGGKSNGEESGSAPAASESNQGGNADLDDEIPF